MPQKNGNIIVKMLHCVQLNSVIASDIGFVVFAYWQLNYKYLCYNYKASSNL